MAILNEWAVMGPNYTLLKISILCLIGAAVMFGSIIFDEKSRYFISYIIIAFIVATASLFVGVLGISFYDDPEHFVPTGKSYIEATFANGAPTAAVLQKYDVIDTDGKVYTLREKDDYKEEKRAKVRIGEKKHD